MEETCIHTCLLFFERWWWGLRGTAMSQLISEPTGSRSSNSHHSGPAGITSDSPSRAFSWSSEPIVPKSRGDQRVWAGHPWPRLIRGCSNAEGRSPSPAAQLVPSASPRWYVDGYMVGARKEIARLQLAGIWFIDPQVTLSLCWWNGWKRYG